MTAKGRIGLLDEVQKQYSEKVTPQQKLKFFASKCISENVGVVPILTSQCVFFKQGMNLRVHLKLACQKKKVLEETRK